MRCRQECFGYLDADNPPLFLEEKYEVHDLSVRDWKNRQGAVVREMDQMRLCQRPRKTELLNGDVEQKALKSLAPPVLVHDDVQRLLPRLLLEQVGNLELERVSNNIHVEEWCGPQIAGYEHLEGVRKAGVSRWVEGVDHDRNGARRMVENIPDTFGSEGDMGARVVVTPWPIGNSTGGVELVVRKGHQPGVHHREEGLQVLCQPLLLRNILRAALTVLRSGDVGVGEPGTGDRGIVGEDMVVKTRGSIADDSRWRQHTPRLIYQQTRRSAGFCGGWQRRPVKQFGPLLLPEARKRE